jgi:type IV secretory pathway TrbL component
MKIKKIDRKEKDSLGFQALIIILSVVQAGIMIALTYNALILEDTKMVGRLLFLALIVLAVLFWAIEKGYLADERVYVIE